MRVVYLILDLRIKFTPLIFTKYQMYRMCLAQAAEICGCVGVIAEVSYEALKKRHDQGWVKEIIDDADKLLTRLKEAKRRKEASSITRRATKVIESGQRPRSICSAEHAINARKRWFTRC